MRFDDWQGSVSLAHHGIKGMKWGVRRYQNADGTLTALGKARYGTAAENNGTDKKTSARKMQRDFNNLDKGFANVYARRQAADEQSREFASKQLKYIFDNNLHKKNAYKKDPTVNKFAAKIVKSAKEYDKAQQQMLAIENLESRIVAKAVNSGYSLKSTPKSRIYTDSYGATRRIHGTNMKIRRPKKGKKPEYNVSMYRNGWT